jgi:hypothetical protein
MIRNLKGLGLALVAVFAMSAMAASGAQAATPTIVAGAVGTFSGDQVGVHEFTVGSRALNCKKAHFSGTSALSQAELTVTFEYKECATTPVLGISFPVTVTPNGCTYTFTNLKHTEEGVPPKSVDYDADVSIICPAGKKIEVHVYSNAGHTEQLCTLTIESNQNDLSGNTITNVAGSPDDLLIHHNVKVKVENHNPNAICGEATSTAEYHGTTTLKALNAAGVQTTLTAITDA